MTEIIQVLTEIHKSGNSYGVRIPKSYIKNGLIDLKMNYKVTFEKIEIKKNVE